MRRAWLLGLAFAIAACSGTVTPAPSGTAGPGAATPSAAGSTPGTPPQESPAAAGSFPNVPIDVSLLRFLPEQVATFAVTYSPEATQGVTGDRTLRATSTGVAYGLAADPATGDVVVAAVVRLREGAFNDGFYRDWRESYDRAACEPAGGVRGRAETVIGGRTVHIGTCNAGARTYHVHLESAGILISATSVGAKRFGEQLVANLRS